MSREPQSDLCAVSSKSPAALTLTLRRCAKWMRPRPPNSRTSASTLFWGPAPSEPEQPRQVVAILDDARQAEDGARRIVGMDRHADAAFLGHRDDGLEEITQV